MYRDQYGGKNHHVKVGYKFCQRVEEFRCLGTILTNQNPILEEIKNRLKVGNAAGSSVFQFAFQKCSSILLSVFRQVHSIFVSEFCTEGDIVILLSISSIIYFP